MPDSEDVSTTTKAPRVGKDTADPAIYLAQTEPLPDDAKQRMRELATEKRPALIPDAPDIASPAQPAPWWVTAQAEEPQDAPADAPQPHATPLPASEFTPDPSNPFGRSGKALDAQPTGPIAAVRPPGTAPGAAQAPAAPLIPPPAWVLAAQQFDAADDMLQATDDTAPAEEDMAYIQWEYCRVQLDAGMYGKQQTVARYPYYVRAAIDYYGAEVPPPASFSEDSDQIEHANKVWGRILGQLGQGNWEMVNVYLGGAKDFAISNIMAYFKRPVQPDRRVNEPKVTL